ncbi:hypothetical protein, partial [Chitiniphilus shinanonensis]|uniref:hypothetical protein n=1 Tax=Chitiniphilus shinanonensis TaxID=553088 RepID=UPI0024E0F86D
AARRAVIHASPGPDQRRGPAAPPATAAGASMLGLQQRHGRMGSGWGRGWAGTAAMDGRAGARIARFQRRKASICLFYKLFFHCCNASPGAGRRQRVGGRHGGQSPGGPRGNPFARHPEKTTRME